MKKTMLFIICVFLAIISLGEMNVSLEQRFASVVASDEGLLIVLKKTGASAQDRVFINSCETTGEELKSDDNSGGYLIPYNLKWPVRIGQRDTGVWFYPLDPNTFGKGLFVREQKLFLGGRNETTGALIYVGDSSVEGRSYKILDEKSYEIIYYDGGLAKTNMLYSTLGTRLTPPDSFVENISDYDNDNQAASDASAETAPSCRGTELTSACQTHDLSIVELTKSEQIKKNNLPWKLIASTCVVLIAVILTVIMIRSRKGGPH